MIKSKYNNAQKARDNKSFVDKKATKGKERLPSGEEIEVTRYSDGSSTHHFGAMAGDIEYDENGEEC